MNRDDILNKIKEIIVLEMYDIVTKELYKPKTSYEKMADNVFCEFEEECGEAFWEVDMFDEDGQFNMDGLINMVYCIFDGWEEFDHE